MTVMHNKALQSIECRSLANQNNVNKEKDESNDESRQLYLRCYQTAGITVKRTSAATSAQCKPH